MSKHYPKIIKKMVQDSGLVGRMQHGITDLPEYSVWRNMLYRCYNENCPLYRFYGGRGLRVCKRWHTSFNFIIDMAFRPGPDYQIDRIDNNKGYNPDNCRWVKKTENMRNTRSTKLDMSKAKEIRELYKKGMNYSEIARQFGVTRTTIRNLVNYKT